MRTLSTIIFISLLPPGQAQLVNGSFENGLNGWNVYCPCQFDQLTGNVSPGSCQYVGEGILDLNCPCTIQRPSTNRAPGC